MQGGADGLVYACLTHVPLGVAFPPYVTPIYMGEAQQAGQLNLRELAPEWVEYHPILGSLAGLFALKNYLRIAHPDATRVGVCQYRKFVSRARVGQQASNYQVMNVMTKEQFAAFDPYLLMLPGDAPFLVGQMGQFVMNGKNYDILYQYKDVHHVEDLLRFTAEAVALGVLDKQDVHPFFGEIMFFPGGLELGVFPADFWLDAVTGIEAVVRSCVSRFSDVRREGYQARAWAFCVERLGSYFLLRHFRRNYPEQVWKGAFIGHLNLINDDGSLAYAVGT